MSELKWSWVYYPYLDPPKKQKESALKAGYNKVYLKSEADKVIVRNKYKRCMAMAKYCEYRFMNLEKMINTEYRTRKMRLSQRWWRIWLKLADKFKEDIKR